MVNKIVKKSLLITLSALMTYGLFAAPSKRDVDRYVYTKYSNATSGGSQAEWGALNCHDPKIFQDDDGTYYVYSTDAAIGGAGQKGIQIRKSTDLVHWECLPRSATQKKWDKAWLQWLGYNAVTASTWAPTVIKQNGLYYMFHGIITDVRSAGYPDAAITLAIASSAEGPFYPASLAASKDEVIAEALNKIGVEYSQSNLVRYTYYDRSFDFDAPESVTEFDCYNTGAYDTHNKMEADINSFSYGFGCIDPEFVADVATGKNMIYEIGGRKCYALTYGSWKGGIALMYVDALSLKPVSPDGQEMNAPADSKDGAFGICIAGGYGAAYEGAQVIYNSDTGYYYIFVSMGGLENEYRVGVGRSKSLDGPYFDAGGKTMYLDPMIASRYHEFGSKIMGGEELKGEFGWRCPGGQSIMRSHDGKILFACHSRTNFKPGYFFFLQIRQMFFTQDGWPVLNHNEYYEDADFTEKLAPLSPAEVAGTYNAVLTVRSSKIEHYTPYGEGSVADVHIDDAVPTPSQELTLNEDGSIGGKTYSGSWKLMEDGYTVGLLLKDSKGAEIGTFKGYVLSAVDWAIKNPVARKVISFTTIDSEKTGEYFWGNKKNK